jgi:hypothetical protein
MLSLLTASRMFSGASYFNEKRAGPSNAMRKERQALYPFYLKNRPD